MSSLVTILVDVSIIVLILAGVRQFRTPQGALRGNLTAAAALLLAIGVVLLRHPVHSWQLVGALLLVGCGAGWWLAVRVSMIQTPALVALQHGAGAVAAFLVCIVELVRAAGPNVSINEVSGLIGLVLGAATFSASLLAAAKLDNRVRQTPYQLPAHNAWLLATAVATIAGALIASQSANVAPVLLVTIVLATVLGLLVAVRVGGADMPVLISFLNATAGLAAALAGVVIDNRLLVAAGATVAASGSVLTIAMCRAMNRSLLAVFKGFKPAVPVPPREAVGDSAAAPEPADPWANALAACRNAGSVIIVPGYGMAMAQAQFEVVELARKLEADGKQVRFAIHPVAGRMPGHMHVLLSEAEAPWEQLCEMPDINDDFASTDVVLVVGASDVVNPAAVSTEHTPISGMPILNAHAARAVVVVNLDDRPGYSGVRNELYEQPQTILLWGDAKATLRKLTDALYSEAELASAVGVSR